MSEEKVKIQNSNKTKRDRGKGREKKISHAWPSGGIEFAVRD